MLKVIFGPILTVVIVILLVFLKRIMWLFGFDPGRARDLFGFSTLLFLLIIFQSFILNGFIFKNTKFFVTGVIIGVPVTIVTNHFYFRNIKDNVLYPTWKYILLAILIGIPLGTWVVHEGFVREALSLMFGICFVDIIGLFVDSMRYEKKHGELYLKKKQSKTGKIQ